MLRKSLAVLTTPPAMLQKKIIRRVLQLQRLLLDISQHQCRRLRRYGAATICAHASAAAAEMLLLLLQLSRAVTDAMPHQLLLRSVNAIRRYLWISCVGVGRTQAGSCVNNGR